MLPLFCSLVVILLMSPFLLFLLNLSFLCAKSFFPSLSELWCCFPRVRRWNSVLHQLFYILWQIHHRSGLLKELCDRSDADWTLASILKALCLFACLLECRKEHCKGEMKPPSSGFIQFAISSFRYSWHCGLVVHQKKMKAVLLFEHHNYSTRGDRLDFFPVGIICTLRLG